VTAGEIKMGSLGFPVQVSGVSPPQFLKTLKVKVYPL
jgi:hypothetical protein